MRIIRGAKKIAKPFVNFPAWMGLAHLKENGKNIADMASSLFATEKAARSETFEQAKKRLHLSEELIAKNAKLFRRLACFFVAAAAFLFLYTVFLFLHGSLSAALTTLAIVVLTCALAFRYHFWLFQIQNKKLGCSFKEWLKGKVEKT